MKICPKKSVIINKEYPPGVLFKGSYILEKIGALKLFLDITHEQNYNPPYEIYRLFLLQLIQEKNYQPQVKRKGFFVWLWLDFGYSKKFESKNTNFFHIFDH